ncbi:MAG: single-stranded-DNA-specific exonuclease RecJ, partial [Fimbriimonadaceae bacterium]|nr:single-stranded-DNA-specific exonuclease RecJ [Alphaproteobacteria bacterium]
MAKEAFFLGVSSSAQGRAWRARLAAGDERVAAAISQQHDLPDLLGRVLAARGVTPQSCQSYLDPSLRDLMPDPSVLQDMDVAAARIAEAVLSGQSITIFGDYDVDGATSSAVLARFLRAVGCPAGIYIPDRIFEGYGPNPDALRQIRVEGADLVITVDCGTASYEALEAARDAGLDTVVLDHHLADAELPFAAAIVNPNRRDDLSGQGHLAAVGVTFLTLVAINRALRQAGWYGDERPEPDLLRWLDLVALGTVCDSVPLVGLNRAFVAKGLLVMQKRLNAGLRALGEVAGMSGPIGPYQLGFQLGPRINAGGRIGRADLGACLLTMDDEFEARDIAATLDRLNGERQEIERVTLEIAMAEAEHSFGAAQHPAILITSGEGWHPGIVGLVATRLKDRFRRPVFAIAFDDKGIGTGSGRSVPGVDLGSAVRACVAEGIIEKGGGHAMAAGLTVDKTRLGDLRAFLEEKLSGAVSTARDQDAMKLDGALTAGSANAALVHLLDRAGPYGSGNPEPRFVFPSHRINYSKIVGNGHIQISLQ